VLHTYNGQEFLVTNGDSVMAIMAENVITAYKHGVQRGPMTNSADFRTEVPGCA